MLLWVGWLACHSRGPVTLPEEDTAGGSLADWVVPLSEARQLRRMSLDLRGHLPHADEIAALRSGSQSLASLRADFLSDPRLEEGVVGLLGSQWPVQAEDFHIGPGLLGLPADQHHAYYRSVGEEPLRLAAHIVVSEQPWSALTQADYTMSTSTMLDIWPLEKADEIDDPGSSDWFPARYIDGRPTMGMLMGNGFLWRYQQARLGRSRAAAISQLLLCHDYLGRPVRFSGESLLEVDDLVEATQSVPSCQSCHSNLDPVASALFGFEAFEGYSLDDAAWYHPERERMGLYYLGTEPGWYGQPLYEVGDLGTAIARDPRMASCAVEQFASALWQRETDLDDFGTLSVLEEDFQTSGLQVQTLLADLTQTLEYQAGGLTESAPEDLFERIATSRMMAPHQLADSIELLTDFRWEEDGWDQLTNDQVGFRVMAGGLQPPQVERPGRDPTATRDLVIKRLAQAAAIHTVGRDLGGGEAWLLDQVSTTTTAADPAFESQIEALFLRLFAEPPTEDDLEAIEELWAQLEPIATPEERWIVLLSSLFRDPRFWTY